ncbi:related to toxD gene [Cephalotrichum gorgonifer]|uniref:Related to toxD protein n=1 Tax=Cephalotrichum gorgonifer TaxID=2041049 RepID=A0AAE8SZ48_9PEZI|nr:related to toxD gene [Cephalotrichum gorgonifer]
MKALVADRNLASRLLNLARGGKTTFGPAGRVTDVPKPTISADEILVKVTAVALNPTDFKHLDIISPPGSILGCDFAGEVVEVGANASKSWKVGDRAAGVVHGGLYPDRGSFAEYLRTDWDLAWHVPSEVSDADATTFGVSATTAVLTLNLHLGLPWPGEAPPSPASSGEQIFIYGGSTSAGLFHIQIAKAAGYTVVTTASPHSHELVKSYGADAVFDYRSPSVAEDIVKEHPGISKAVDCYSEGKSTDICGEVLRNKGGKVVTLLPSTGPKIPGVTYELVMAYTMMGRPFQWLAPIGPKYEAKPDDRKGLARFYASLPGIVNAGTLRPIPVEVSDGGFEDILAGLNRLREKKVSGKKLVVKF